VFEQAAFKAAKERAESDQAKTLELVGELQRQLEAARQHALLAQEQTYQESLREDSAVSMWSKEVEFLNSVLESQSQSHTRGEHFPAKK
jgi:hypothetical protein